MSSIVLKSLEELRDDILDVRLAAGNSSLWNINATVARRARLALNDAVQTYDVPVPLIYDSVLLRSGQPVVLPANIHNIVEVVAIGTSGNPRTVLTNINHVPTAQTNLLYVRDVPFARPGTRIIRIEGETTINEFPETVAVGATFLSSDLSIAVTGGTPKDVWPPIGYFELRQPNATTDQREVIFYQEVLPGHFTGLTRGIAGSPITWSAGALISVVYPAEKEMISVISKAAEANMYSYWLAHRAQYDKFSAAYNVASLDVPDILALTRTLEDTADRRYKRAKKSPKPGKARRKGRRR